MGESQILCRVNKANSCPKNYKSHFKKTLENTLPYSDRAWQDGRTKVEREEITKKQEKKILR